MSITQRSVQEDIAQATPPDMDRLVGDVSEDDAVGVHPPGVGLLPNHGLPVWRESQQPQNTVRHALQDITPAITCMV